MGDKKIFSLRHEFENSDNTNKQRLCFRYIVDHWFKYSFLRAGMVSSLRVLTALNSIFDSVGISSELLAAKYNASVNENNNSSDELDGSDCEIKE